MSHPIKHFITITRHRHRVIALCFRAGIGFQGLFHDLSKYSPAEFIPGAKYYQGTRSPNEEERRLYGYSLAWMHHKGRNKHHFEYWSDLNTKTGYYESVPMPTRFIKEMFCDRVAASKIYKGKNYTNRTALDYYLASRARQRMHPSTADTLEALLNMLAEKGEEETFKYIKSLKNKP